MLSETQLQDAERRREVVRLAYKYSNFPRNTSIRFILLTV